MSCHTVPQGTVGDIMATILEPRPAVPGRRIAERHNADVRLWLRLLIWATRHAR